MESVDKDIMKFQNSNKTLMVSMMCYSLLGIEDLCKILDININELTVNHIIEYFKNNQLKNNNYLNSTLHGNLIEILKGEIVFGDKKHIRKNRSCSTGRCCPDFNLTNGEFQRISK